MTAAPPAAGGPGPASPNATPAAVTPVTLCLIILATIAVVAGLYLARAFFVPLLIGILVSYALRPLVDTLSAWHLPRAAGAALVLGALIGGASWAAARLGADAAAMIEQLPDAARKVRQQVSDAREEGPTALQSFQEAASELQGAASDAAGENLPAKTGSRTVAVRVTEPSIWLSDYMLAQSALLFSVAAQAPIVLLLAYFLLASGAHFRRKAVQLVGPSLARKKDTVRMLEEIDEQVQRYLLVSTGANVLVGLVTWLAFAALGMEHAAAWGATAALLHFIPYLGPLVFAIASGMAGFMQFGVVFDAVVVAAVSLLIAAAVGSLIMTWLQSRFARINPAVLFMALLFFGWLWGIWGLLLGAPLVAIGKVICDRVEPLRPVGELLGA